MELKSGIEDAVYLAGSQTALAEKLGVTPQAVSKWVARGWAPVLRVVEIEQATGIPRARLLNPRVLELLGNDDL